MTLADSCIAIDRQGNVSRDRQSAWKIEQCPSCPVSHSNVIIKFIKYILPKSTLNENIYGNLSKTVFLIKNYPLM